MTGPPLLWSSLESKSGLYSNQTVTFFAQMFKDSASSHLLFDCCFLFDHSCFLCRPWRTLSSWSSLTMDGSCVRKPSLKGSMRMITSSSSVFKFWNILSTRGKIFANLIMWFQMLLCKSSIYIFCGQNAKVLSQIECSIYSFLLKWRTTGSDVDNCFILSIPFMGQIDQLIPCLTPWTLPKN